MKRVNFGIVTILFLSLVFLTAGCAKKATPNAEEVKAPAQQEVKIEQPAPAPEKQAESQVAAPAALSSLEEGIKSFEGNNIYFDFDKFSLTPEAKEILAQKAEFLKGNTNVTIQIQGNCDERGTTEYNLALGERRAKVAQDYLMSLGIVKDRITTLSYGKERPIDSGHDEEAWSKNRNDHFAIVNK